jgi:uncharacterized membrane protein YqiK
VAHDGTQGRDAYAIECKRCGAVQRFATPIAISVWCAAARAFERQHATCKQAEENAKVEAWKRELREEQERKSAKAERVRRAKERQRSLFS